jgi:hypothetical protein
MTQTNTASLYGEVIGRLEGAAGPDREIDRDLYWLLRRPAAERAYWNAAMGMPRPLGDRMPGGLGSIGVESASPRYTASLDATLALVEEKKPGWAWSVGNLRAGGQAYLMNRPGGAMIEGKASSPALAVLIALLRALEGE